VGSKVVSIEVLLSFKEMATGLLLTLTLTTKTIYGPHKQLGKKNIKKGIP
jgi:hypothetical protein